MQTTWRVLVGTGAAAAVVAGIVALGTHGSGTDSKSANVAAPATTAHRAVAPRVGIAFGEVSQPEVLLAKVRAHLQLAANGTIASATPTPRFGTAAGSAGIAGLLHDGLAAPAPAQGPQGPAGAAGSPIGQHGAKGPAGATTQPGVEGDESVQAATGPVAPPGSSTVAGAQSPQAATGLQGATAPAGASPTGALGGTGTRSAAASPTIADCVAVTVAVRPGLSVPPVLTGRGSDAGRPVFVAVFAQGTSYSVLVLSASDCSVVGRQTLP